MQPPASTTATHVAPEPSSTDVAFESGGKLRELLRRYPDVSSPEADELVALFQAALPVERALMMSDEDLAPKLNQLRADNRRALRTPFRQYVVLLAIAASGIATTAYVVIAGG